MLITNTLREQVKAILEEHPAARESDQVLFWYWLKEHATDPDRMSATDFLGMIEKNEIPKMEAMTRTRRWVQEHFPPLRPHDYDERSLHQDDVVQQLGYAVPAHQTRHGS